MTMGVERFEVVTSNARLEEIAKPWMDLWRDVDGLIFQSHAWISGWWQATPDSHRRKLRIGLIWQGDKLLAVLPLAINRRKGLRFLEWAANSYADYGDILAAPECPTTALARLWRMTSAMGGYDIAFLNRLQPDAIAHRLIAPAIEAARLRPNHRTEASYRVAGDWANGTAWLNAQSKKTRQNYRRSIKILQESGEIRFRLVGDGEPVQPILDRLAILKRKWLATHARQSQLFDEGAPILAALVQALADQGLLRIFVLECNDVVIAVSVNFVQRNTMMAFVTTYDPDFSRGSPGMVLMMDYIMWSIDQGLSTVDFLCGAEAFKERFATHSLRLSSASGARTLTGAALSLADSLRHKFRNAKPKKPATASVPDEQAMG
ncbi:MULTISPECIES: GNAT family N-acetyltransferase [unclassified Sinorhizobium]|uniref:GNAT family N-acetyltransferase n=1 Tax=unclassified Sinorhizobium TaxID=2613772 RepID=UPI003523E9FB